MKKETLETVVKELREAREALVVKLADLDKTIETLEVCMTTDSTILTLRTHYKRVAEACRGAFKLPRPWMDGGITYAEWDAAFTAIEEALAWKLPELFRPNEAPYDWNGQNEL